MQASHSWRICDFKQYVSGTFFTTLVSYVSEKHIFRNCKAKKGVDLSL